MKNSIYRLALIMSFLTFLGVGCSEEDKENAKDAAASAVQAGENTVKASEVMNTWASECKPAEKLPPLSEKVFLQYSGETFTKVEEYYVSGDCTDIAATVKYTGKFMVKGDVAEAPGADQVDIELETVSVTANNEVGRTTLATINFCGQTTWELNQTVDLTGATDEAICPAFISSVPNITYDVFVVENDTLFLGVLDDAKNKASPEAGPVTIDREPTRAFKKTDRQL